MMSFVGNGAQNTRMPVAIVHSTVSKITLVTAEFSARPTLFGADGSTPLPADQQPFGDLAGAKFGAVPVLTVEVLYTFFLVFVVLRSAVSSKNPEYKEYFPIAIAFTVLAGAYGAGVVSGGCFNPAVAIGIDVTSAWAGVEWCIPYALAEFLGAAIAVGVNSIMEGEGKGAKYA